MRKPYLQEDTFMADLSLARQQRDTLHVWWLGQSGYLVVWNDVNLLLDPYLSDSLTKKYAETPKPHVRMTELVVTPERLDFIDVVTSSHNHTDHLDGETLIPLMDVNPDLTVIVPEANRAFAADRLQTSTQRLTGITCDARWERDDLSISAVPAAHEELDTDDAGHYRCIGLVVQVGPWWIYHSGDTMWYEGIADQVNACVASGKSIDLALLPINGRDPKRGVAGNLNGQEAVQLARAINAQMLFPCHYDMFEFNTVSPDAFVDAAKVAGQPYTVLQNGERWSMHQS